MPVPNYLEYLRDQAQANFANPNHDPENGRFAEKNGKSGVKDWHKDNTRTNERYSGDYKMEYISPEMGNGLHKIVATYGDTVVGQMSWSSKQIEGLDVSDTHQRKGLATAMWNWGQEMRPRPKHSNDRTDQGDAWAKAIGGPIPRRLETQKFEYSTEIVELAGNPNHDPQNGRFTTKEGTSEEKQIDEFVKKYGPEFPPKLSGTQWSYEGASSEITQAANEQLQGDERDPEFSPSRIDWTSAETILNTLHTENKRNDVPLYSGHHRQKDDIDEQLKDGSVFFPLVATSPNRTLAEQYAGGGEHAIAVIYHFPTNHALAQPYRVQEYIGTGEYQITGHKWKDDRHIQIDLKLTKANPYKEGE